MKIGIIGFGRFGQLLAKILKGKNEIKVFDKVNKPKTAKRIGVCFCDLKETCQQNLIILAVPISEMKNVLLKIKDKLKQGQIIMDTCSVKEFPAKLMLKHLPKKVEIVASHPLFGPDSAKHGLKRLQVVFCPLRIKAKSFNKVKKIFKDLGLRIIKMSPEKHDQQSALSLNLVHFIGRALEGMNVSSQKITTLGFERFLKVLDTVKNDTWQLFSDIQHFNRFTEKTRKKFLKSALEINKKLNLKK